MDAYWKDRNKSGVVIGIPDADKATGHPLYGSGFTSVTTIRGKDFTEAEDRQPPGNGFLDKRFGRR